ncbi:MAG: discoidin domain-containing protein [Pirellulales bacterium]|nr:discoidin domain-containing protein [Pirellulales bacterium]
MGVSPLTGLLGEGTRRNAGPAGIPRLLMVLLLATATATTSAVAGERLDLSGPWQFRLDPGDAGVEGKWFDQQLPRQIELPGSLQEQGFGEEVSVDTNWVGGIVDRSWFTDPAYERYRRPGNVKVPFWLQPQRHYVGPAWYQRTVTVPGPWQGKRITLHLQRCHWDTTVWVNGKPIGSRSSLSTPHEYDLTGALVPGAENRRDHTLTLRVDNRLKIGVGVNAHSVSDHTQTDWNGVIGRIELRATDRVWIDDVQVYPNVADKSAKVRVVLGNRTFGGGDGTLTVRAEGFNTAPPHRVAPKQVPLRFEAADQATVEFDYPMGDGVQLWDEFHPALYRLSVELDANTREMHHADRRTVAFGMRHLTTRGTQFVLNGRPLFLRGTLECCIFPLTGYPPTDVAPWKRIIAVCRAHGLNHMRFHSHCPPEAAFVAADEAGFYFQVECAAWANQGSAVGDGKPIDAWLYAEAESILRAYGNHPSLMLLAYGNEPAGRNQNRWLGDFVNHCKRIDPRRLYTSAAGWPVIPENQYHNTPGPRIQAWGAGLRSRINARPPETTTDYRSFAAQYEVPVVSHEIGQWCVYPNFDEISKYTGVLKAKNFEIFRDTLSENHMGDQARDFLMASGKLQTLCYKEEIESALRTPGFGGFQLLDLHDFPGQGTALVGVLDPFWDDKPYVSPGQFRRFCNATVPLARLPKRIFTVAEHGTALVEVAHFGPADLTDADVTWKVLDAAGRAICGGRWAGQTIATGRLNTIGRLDFPLDTAKRPQKLRLVVGIDGTPFENDWDLWVYPKAGPAPALADVHVTAVLDQASRQRLKAGGKVLLLPDPQRVAGGVEIGFSSIFWNTAWTGGQAPHTLGILCEPTHPALATFPTDYHSNWQWWELISRSGAMVLDEMPPKLRPIVQPIDTWFSNRRLGLVFEARVHGGSLLACSIDLDTDLDNRPVARQLRHSLLRYMAGDEFHPQTEVDVDAIGRLFRPATTLERLGATASSDSTQPGYEAGLAIDGNPQTLWHTAWQPQPSPHPHQLVLDLGTPVALAGITYLPRQDMANGRIAQYEIYTSPDGKKWGKPIAAGTWPDSPQRQTVRFDRAVAGRLVKLVAHSEINGNPWAAVAELDVVLDEPDCPQ